VSTAPGWWTALGRERARPARLRDWPHAGWLAVGTVCFGAFMGQLDASIVTLTYQPLRAEFHASLAEVQWVSLAYLLALTALLIPIGRFADARGRKILDVILADKGPALFALPELEEQCRKVVSQFPLFEAGAPERMPDEDVEKERLGREQH